MGRDKRNEGRGEGIGETFVPLVDSVLKSSAWKSLHPVERCLLIALRAKVGRKPLETNGHVFLSVRAAAEELQCSTRRAMAAFHTLQERGFIEVTKVGSLGLGGEGKATTYRLTCCGAAGQPRPSKLYATWEPGSGFPVTKGRAPVTKRASPAPTPFQRSEGDASR